MTWAKVVVSMAVLALIGGVVCTQEAGQKKLPSKDKEGPSEAKPATHKVEKKPFKVELVIKGILEATEKVEIVYRTQPTVQHSASHGPMTIRQIVPHGAKVTKGEVLATFDTTKINEVIADLQKEKLVLEVGLKLAEEELTLFERSAPVDLATAESAKKRADDELKYFLDIGRGETEKRVNMMVKSEKFDMEYSQEELRQLEKMYKANDLTEETEKMILRRQQNSVEMATFWYQSALIERDYMFKHTLPTREKLLKETQQRAELQLARAQLNLGPTLSQKQNAIAKMRFDQDKQAARLARLLKDRQAMTIHSPLDGIAYHGRFQKGNWSASESRDSKLVINGTVSPDDVFLTVLQARPVLVHASVGEKDVHLLKPGLAGKATALFNPQRKIPAKVGKLAAVPASPGKFDVEVALEVADLDSGLMPGMACTVKFVPYLNKEAIAVPSKAIHEEEEKEVVYVMDKGGKQEKREVVTGRSDGELTEITSGLREGEEILLERPTSKTPAKDSGGKR